MSATKHRAGGVVYEGAHILVIPVVGVGRSHPLCVLTVSVQCKCAVESQLSLFNAQFSNCFQGIK